MKGEIGASKMERRQFLGMIATGVATAALGGAAHAAAGSVPAGAKQASDSAKGSPKQEAKASREVELVAYCGRYCGNCPVSAFSVTLGLKALEKVNDAVGVSKSAKMLGFPPIRDMAVHCCANFDSEVASIAEIGKIAFTPGCRNGCVPCDIPRCCKARGYMTCAECDQTATCAKLGKYPKHKGEMDANQKAIREHGLEKWAKMKYDEAIAERKASLHNAIDDAFSSGTPLE